MGPALARAWGVLLHPTSLPGPGSSGNLGAEAYRFVDFLAAARCQYWQILPLGPTHAEGSPYNSLSAFAGNPALIDFADLPNGTGAERAGHWHNLFTHAQRLQQPDHAQYARRFSRFKAQQRPWLEDYALFMAVRRDFEDQPWPTWPEPIRLREPRAMDAAREQHRDAMELFRYEQFLFHEQWLQLKHYAQYRNVTLIGDMPFFVAHDSVDVWAHREYFDLDGSGHARTVTGVPPDYFSASGQRWGNPHYNWAQLQRDDFLWWRQRLQRLLTAVGLVRIDHFRGLESVWEIAAESVTAEQGRWIKVPGKQLLERLQTDYAALPLIAEDLGIITPEVAALRDEFGLAGTRVLQFAFNGDADNPHLPHNFAHNCAVYTGTHDNDTTLSWYRSEPSAVQQKVDAYLGYSREPMPWPLVRCALASVARLAILPLQDVLALDSGFRMNTPGTVNAQNWQFRFSWDQLEPGLADRLHGLAAQYGRNKEMPGQAS